MRLAAPVHAAVDLASALGARSGQGRGSLSAAEGTDHLEGAVSTPEAPTQPPGAGSQPSPSPSPPRRRKREILGPTGLVVMVLAILAFTVVSIVIEVVSNQGKSYAASIDVLEQIPADPNEYQVVFHITNKGTKAGRPDVCEASLFDLRGERVGTASVRLRTPIQPGRTLDELAVATAASRPINGQVTCRSLEPD
jgi:hypothetical protein